MRGKRAIIVHGGVGWQKKAYPLALKEAAWRGFLSLSFSGEEAIAEACFFLEDSGQFNAGWGSYKRTDGTIRTDAGMMNSRGEIGAVAASAFAYPSCQARALLQKEINLEIKPSEDNTKFSPFSSLDIRTPRKQSPSLKVGTVGAVALDTQGNFWAISSTGGRKEMPPGRVGDTPLPGAGFYAGKEGAFAATGIGEEIMKRCACFYAYQNLEKGASLSSLLHATLNLFPPSLPFGIIAITAKEIGAGSNRSLPFCFLHAEGGEAAFARGVKVWKLP